ncbi:hypothetical protein OC834_006996 [Tilletia horrida]|nr:hypothetical protein OC834_006996 [Tilletia horrida]
MSQPAPAVRPAAPLSSIPIADRPGPVKWVQLVLFVAVFLFAMLCEHGTQLLLFPLSFSPKTRPLYEEGIAYTKLAFGRNLCLISQLFAPSRIVVSFADESGRYLDPELFVVRAPGAYNSGAGRITKLNLPERSVLISNHQIYLDWLYLWLIAYYAELADAVHIVLKASLKWTPIVGPAMQFYNFIFMHRKWDEDKKNLSDQLAILAEKSKPYSSHTSVASSVDAARREGSPNKLLFLIFPEGTLVSEESRPGSKKYADKIGQPDCRNMVLPRSTGLFFCLRTLAADIADLKLIDMTIGYPGIPPAGTGQKYYTLRSVYMDGVPPPNVHVHITISRISSFIAGGSDSPPLGKLPKSARDSPKTLPTDEEKQMFEAWLLRRWRKKDDLMDRFYKDGDFVGGAFAQTAAAGEYRRPEVIRLESAPNGEAPAKAAKKESLSSGKTGEMKWVEIPAELQSPIELGHVFCWFAPVFALYYAYKVVRFLTG